MALPQSSYAMMEQPDPLSAGAARPGPRTESQAPYVHEVPAEHTHLAEDSSADARSQAGQRAAAIANAIAEGRDPSMRRADVSMGDTSMRSAPDLDDGDDLGGHDPHGVTNGSGADADAGPSNGHAQGLSSGFLDPGSRIPPRPQSTPSGGRAPASVHGSGHGPGLSSAHGSAIGIPGPSIGHRPASAIGTTGGPEHGPKADLGPISVMAAATISPERRVYRATYSNVEVLELDVNSVSVMRRVRDSALNATQILKLAGVDKFRRIKILEKELQPGYEKVQGGYGKYQGTWTPYDDGVKLCRQYGVMDTLEPLLRYDMSEDSLKRTPTKEQALAAKRQWARGSPGWVRATSAGSGAGQPDSQGLHIAGAQSQTQIQSQTQAQAGATTSAQATPRAAAHKSNSQGETPGSHIGRAPSRVGGPAGASVLENPEPLLPIDISAPNFERSRDIITELFLNLAEEPSLDTILNNHRDAGEIDIDVPIDDSGHSALHWAAALGRIQLVRDLIRHGAQPRRGNYLGESPLVRAVLVTNNSDVSTFVDLLDELYPALYLTDHAGRTVLHHIALTSGIKGRSDASRYYLGAMLEWVVRRGATSSSGQFSLNTFITAIVNYQDYNGDTALNIAARIGNKHIARQLIEVGADIYIGNRAGLRPVDFGVDTASTVISAAKENARLRSDSPADRSLPAEDRSGGGMRGGMPPAKRRHLEPQNSAAGGQGANQRASGFGVTGPGPRIMSAAEKRQEMMGIMIASIKNLDGEFERELASKQELIEKVHDQLRDATSTLNMYKQHADHLRQVSGKLSEWKRGSESLQAAIEAENQKFKEEELRHGRSDMSAYEGEFDPDEPFRVDPDGEAIAQGRIPPVLLEARISAYRKNQAHLLSFRDELKGRSTELESKFRQVVSLCTGVPEGQVDDVLEGLVQAVESDTGEVDMARISGFLRKIETQ